MCKLCCRVNHGEETLFEGEQYVRDLQSNSVRVQGKQYEDYHNPLIISLTPDHSPAT